jgi:hypothetical protein
LFFFYFFLFFFLLIFQDTRNVFKKMKVHSLLWNLWKTVCFFLFFLYFFLILILVSQNILFLICLHTIGSLQDLIDHCQKFGTEISEEVFIISEFLNVLFIFIPLIFSISIIFLADHDNFFTTSCCSFTFPYSETCSSWFETSEHLYWWEYECHSRFRQLFFFLITFFFYLTKSKVTLVNRVCFQENTQELWQLLERCYTWHQK